RARPERPLLGPRAMQLLFGSRDGDVEQPALFLDGILTGGMADGDEPALETYEEHDRPFEALGGVEGCQLDTVVAAIAGFDTDRRGQPHDEPVDGRAGVEREVLVRQTDELGQHGPTGGDGTASAGRTLVIRTRRDLEI